MNYARPPEVSVTPNLPKYQSRSTSRSISHIRSSEVRVTFNLLKCKQGSNWFFIQSVKNIRSWVIHWVILSSDFGSDQSQTFNGYENILLNAEPPPYKVSLCIDENLYDLFSSKVWGHDFIFLLQWKEVWPAPSKTALGTAWVRSRALVRTGFLPNPVSKLGLPNFSRRGLVSCPAGPPFLSSLPRWFRLVVTYLFSVGPWQLRIEAKPSEKQKGNCYIYRWFFFSDQTICY